MVSSNCPTSVRAGIIWGVVMVISFLGRNEVAGLGGEDFEGAGLPLQQDHRVLDVLQANMAGLRRHKAGELQGAAELAGVGVGAKGARCG